MKTGRRACKTRRPVGALAVGLGILITFPGCPSPEPSIDDRPEDAEGLGPAPDTQELDSPEGVAVELFDTEGERAGRISFHPMNGVLRVWGTLVLPEIGAGERGFHIHESGACDPPDFESAGDHFDPHGAPHGSPEAPPGERHLGDLGNVSFDSEGRAEIEFLDPEISLQEGPEGIRGRSVVVHESPDDFATQPDGDAGARMACGVIEP